jgi:gliding motility-associated-like protein
MAKHLFHLCLTIAIFQCCFFSPNYCSGSTNARGYLLCASSANALKIAAPVITESGSPSGLNTVYGTMSASTSFIVSGSNMTAGISISPTTGFEVSTDNITFSNSVTVGSAGTIPNTTVYLRLAATAGGGGHSGNIRLSSAGAATVNVAEANSTVSPAPLTVTATDVNKMYGTTLNGGSGSANFTVAGLQNGETIGSVSIGYGTGAQPTDAVATYSSCVTIANATGGTFSPANYNTTYVAGNINVTPAPLSIIANNVAKTYGATLTGGPGSTAFTAVGLQNGETIGTVTIGYGTGATATDPAGIYEESVTVAAGTGGNFSGHNYIITHVPGTITVLSAPLTITANDVTKTYGTVLTGGPGSTAFTATGLQNGETIGSVSIGYGTAAAANALPGTCYACVSIANATGGTFDPNNYNITYVSGNINVVPAPLTITADDKIKLYGEPNPVLTVTYSGFVNGEGPGQLTTQAVISTTASTTSAPGQYPITVDGASDPNYTIAHVPGILTITQSYNIPNAFTPNGDGVNDTWHIQFLDAYQNCTISIFNRLGQNVYSSIGYGTPWNGTYHGAALPAGAYYYIINLKNINRILSGYVTIIR